ncbi:MAG: polyribonucleotide nucleotidyltransferase [Bacteroidetes bacterium]|nr:polyribonucleotide nucleotidyltransferase [Bacteroidota bacterium]MBR3090445.1 polyribonucleotide nucleotidyltransferase [Bacteroidota bacterium]
MKKITSTIEFDGKTYSLETGRLAKFANSVFVSCNDTQVLVTAVASENELTDIDFLPLQVEYKEKLSAAGKVPGSFLKREGRPSDHEILCSRLIDRPIRPMIPKTWHFETQVIANVFSYEPDVNPDTLAAVGASAALLISDIPFDIPVSEVRVGRFQKTQEFIINPSDSQLKDCDIDITVAGTDAAIIMVEGEMKEISEEDFINALDFAHQKIRQLNQLQKDFCAQVEIKKRPFVEEVIPEDIVSFIEDNCKDEMQKYVHTITTKNERHDTRNKIKESILELTKEKFSVTDEHPEYEEYTDKLERWVDTVTSKLEKKLMRSMILEEHIRLDGRSLTQIRPIECEVGLLARVHGSSLFTRGETQSLTSVTLGTSRDEQIIDGLAPVYNERFILHYNFPPFSVGETGKLTTGRREIGHGHLAWRALKEMLPSQAEFPYTIRVVSDILESNGSSSMATVCAGSLAMFHAGIPLKKQVAGIAMGLIKEEDKIAILSDILGDEDFLGDMDFKVTGTKDGITACQMDIKIDEGLSVEFMRKALEQAKEGRMHILGIMNQCIAQPNKELSKYAPRFETIKIPQDTIGAVIGQGGETIRTITKETGTEINIEEDGTVLIASVSKEACEAAKEYIYRLTRKPQEGEIYKNCLVKEIKNNIGAIVEFLPKTSGLLHISLIAHERVDDISKYLKIGDRIDVKLIEIKDGKYRLSRKALLPRPNNTKKSKEKDNKQENKEEITQENKQENI